MMIVPFNLNENGANEFQHIEVNVDNTKQTSNDILQCFRHIPNEVPSIDQSHQDENTGNTLQNIIVDETHSNQKSKEDKITHCSHRQIIIVLNGTPGNTESVIPRDENLKGRCHERFPVKLYNILMNSDDGGYSSIITWLPHGRAFKIHDNNRFEREIMVKYFSNMKIDSFKRQLYLNGFQKVRKGFTDSGAYFHELFLIGRSDLCEQIVKCVKPSHAPAMITETILPLIPNFRSFERGRNHERFPVKLFTILMKSNASGYSSIITWLLHGRAFKIHNENRFEKEILKRYFNQLTLDSFKRQLYLHGFQKVGKRYDGAGAYFHKFFLIGRFDSCHQIKCVKKSTMIETFPLLAPNFQVFD